jgi:hypothetical protein
MGGPHCAIATPLLFAALLSRRRDDRAYERPFGADRTSRGCAAERTRRRSALFARLLTVRMRRNRRMTYSNPDNTQDKPGVIWLGRM